MNNSYCPYCQMYHGSAGCGCTRTWPYYAPYNPYFPNYSPTPTYGWVCPKCQGVYAPSTPSCMRCVPWQITNTSGTVKND